MKNKLYKSLLVLIIIISSVKLFGQWETVYWPVPPPGQLPDLNRVEFVNSNKGMAVGGDINNAYIIRTIDAGTTWDTAYTLTNSYYWPNSDITFSNNLTAYAIVNNLLVKTTDFGNTWGTTIFNNNLKAINFPSDSIGYIIGYTSSIYKTTNAGNTWNQLITGITSPSSLFFVNDTVGYISHDSSIFKTTNGGVNWTPSNTGYLCSNVVFPSDSIGYCFGIYPYSVNDTLFILKTIDGGTNWFKQYAMFGASFTTIMCFANDSTGYFTGIFQMYKTVDGGLTWNFQSSSPPSWGNFFDWVADVFFLNQDTGFAVGNLGQFYRTYNGGNTIVITKDNKYITYDVQFNAFPNPFDDYTTLTFDYDSEENYTINILDVSGKMVRQINNIKTNKIKIYKNRLSEGLYFAQIFSDKKIIGIV